METKTLTIYDFEGNGRNIDCPIGQNYIYSILIISGDEILTVFDKNGQPFANFDSNDYRTISVYEALAIFTSFEDLINRPRK